MNERVREDECCFAALQLSREHLDKLRGGRILDTPKNEAGGTFGERERERCTHYLHSEKGVGSQSSPPPSLSGGRGEEKSK